MLKEDFNKYIENRVRKLVNEYKILENNEKIAVALSGGKDSILTLHLLNKFKDEFNLDLVAITIDEGISGYRNKGVAIARKNADDLGVKFIKKSFADEFNFKIDDVYNLYKSACIPCGVFRRYLLNKTAYEIGAVKIATGHNLDDEVQSFLMSFARADFRRFAKFGPKLDTIHPKLIPRIKPLWNTPEKEAGMWAVLNNIDVHFAECPYSHMSLRSKMKDHLNRMEEKIPGTKVNMLESFKKTFEEQNVKVELYECVMCNEPSSSSVCKVCEMLEEIRDMSD